MQSFFQPLEIHETVAECMIFANNWVAKKIAEAFPNSALVRFFCKLAIGSPPFVSTHAKQIVHHDQ